MTFAFADMATAIETYPDTNVVVDIRDFDPVTGDSLNEDEEATFEVRITNSGLLNMNAVTVRVKAENGATLKRPLDVPNTPVAGAKATPSTWVTELVSKPVTSVAANGGTGTTEVFTLKAPPGDTGGVSKKLLTVTLEGWDADLGYLLNDKSKSRSAVKDTHSEIVHPL
jgi:hypothetical protein